MRSYVIGPYIQSIFCIRLSTRYFMNRLSPNKTVTKINTLIKVAVKYFLIKNDVKENFDLDLVEMNFNYHYFSK